MKKNFSQNRQDTARNKKSRLVLMDFFSSWSAPCNTQAAILEELSVSSKGMVDIVKVNMDDPDSDSEKYCISALPTLCLLKDGVEIKRFIGVQPLETLINEIKYLNL